MCGGVLKNCVSAKRGTILQHFLECSFWSTPNEFFLPARGQLRVRFRKRLRISSVVAVIVVTRHTSWVALRIHDIWAPRRASCSILSIFIWPLLWNDMLLLVNTTKTHRDAIQLFLDSFVSRSDELIESSPVSPSNKYFGSRMRVQTHKKLGAHGTDMVLWPAYTDPRYDICIPPFGDEQMSK